MESLYRKYRPQTFGDVVGQRHVVSTLEHAVLEGRTSHAYLFCGPRGTGKTTMARLLAKALMCEQGPGHLPDGTCEQCQLIAAGEHPDVNELDAASRTGVDNVREEIIGRVGYAPVRGNYKVYIIDEVHMLTPAAFNALLKTLEEPPSHVVFVMCTTDPQKIPETILSRVQRFDFHSISSAEIEEHLKEVCQSEGFEFDEQAIQMVVRHARGGMRDALSTLEQLSVFGNGSITAEAARDMLGEVAGSMLVSTACAIAARDVAGLFASVAELVNGGRDLLQFTRELAGHLRDVYVVCAVGSPEGVVSGTPEQLRQLKDEAMAFGSADRVARALDVMSDASAQMRTATNQRLVLEVALTRVARPQADLTLDALADRVAVLERELAEVKAGGVVMGAAAAAVPVAAAVPAPEPERASVPVVTQVEKPAATQDPQPTPVSAPAPVPQPVPAPQPVSAPQPAPAPAPPPQPAAAAGPQSTAPLAAVADAGELQRRWRQVIDNLMHKDPPRGSLLMSSSAISDDGAQLLVNLPKGSSFAVKMLDRADVRAVIDPMVTQVFGRRTLVYAESSLAGADIARKQRSAAPAPAPAPAQAPAPAPAPQGASAPSYPAPWDAPAPAQAPAPPSAPEPDMVPYDDADVYAYDGDGYQDPPAPAPAPSPAQQQAPTPQPALGPQPESGQKAAPAPQPVSVPPEAGLPQDMEALLGMLTEVFGDGVKMSVEPAGN